MRHHRQRFCRFTDSRCVTSIICGGRQHGRSPTAPTPLRHPELRSNAPTDLPMHECSQETAAGTLTVTSSKATLCSCAAPLGFSLCHGWGAHTAPILESGCEEGFEEPLRLARDIRPSLSATFVNIGCSDWVDMSVIHMFVCSIGDDGAAGVIGGSHHVHIVPEADAS